MRYVVKHKNLRDTFFYMCVNSCLRDETPFNKKRYFSLKANIVGSIEKNILNKSCMEFQEYLKL